LQGRFANCYTDNCQTIFNRPCFCHAGLVTILTREKDSYTREHASGLTAAKALGIQVRDRCLR